MSRIDTVVSHGDWFNAWGSFGRPSVYRIVDQCATSGIKRINWRTFLGARAHYHSDIEPVAWGGEGIERPGYEAEPRLAYDLRTWDPLADAVEISHERGIEIAAWSTIYEETHVQTVTTNFAANHPEYHWKARDGYRRESKLVLRPEVVEYKLSLIREQLEYGVDAICLDFFRENHTFAGRHLDLRPKHEVDETGTCIYGYDDYTVKQFVDEYDIDPWSISNDAEIWLAFRAEQVTSFIRAVKALCNSYNAKLSVIVRSMLPILAPFPYWEPESAPTNSLKGSFVDWPAWVAEGAVDDVIVLHEHWDLMALDLMTMFLEIRDAATRMGASDASLSAGIWCYNMHDASVKEGKAKLELAVNGALQAGANGVTLWESTPIHGWGSSVGGGGGVDIGLWSAVRTLADSGPEILT